MEPTDHDDGPDRESGPNVDGEKFLSKLSALANQLSELEKRRAYKVRVPDLVKLFESDRATFDLAVNATTMIVDEPNGLCNVIVVGDQSSAVAKASKGLRRVETERTGSPECASKPALVVGTERLARVLHDDEPVVCSERTDRVHICRATIKLDRHDRFRPRCNRPFRRGRIDQMVTTTVDQNGAVSTLACFMSKPHPIMLSIGK